MEAASAQPIPPEKPQGYRFHKSGSASPIHQGMLTSASANLSRSESLPIIANSFSSPSRLDSATSSLVASKISLTSSFGSSSGNIDQKLYQIVRRITSTTPSLLVANNLNSKNSLQARKNSINSILDIVLDKHREYRRKDREAVRSGVEGVLKELAGETNNNSGGGSANSGAKKRRIPLGGGSEQPNSANSASSPTEFESAKRAKKNTLESGANKEFIRSHSLDAGLAQSREALFVIDRQPADSERNNENATTKTGGMLNASLRNRYKDVQREREANVSSAMEPISESSPTTVNSPLIDANTNTPMNDGTVSLAEKDADASATPAKPSSVTASSTPTPKKKKKKLKKTPSKSSSIDNNPNYDTGVTSNSMLLLPSPRPTERYSTLGGISALLTTIRQLIEYPLSHPELFTHLGIEPPRGVLLRGPPGCGKTHLAKAIAGELNVSYFQVSAPELVGGVSGESEGRVRTLFESAAQHAPSIVFIDEIDAIAPKRGDGGGGGGKSMEKRIVAQLLTSMDGMVPDKTRDGGAVIVMGATNRPDALDPALRRAGRFDREIVLGAPDEAAREGIIRVMTSQMRLEGTLDYRLLAKKTPGFVGADVRSLTKEAAVIAINRIFKLLNNGADVDEKDNKDGEDDTLGTDAVPGSQTTPSEDPPSNDIRDITPLTSQQLQPLYITMDDFLNAIPNVQPSSKREGFATVPDVSWSDIGALAEIREELTLSVLEPIAHPEKFEALGLPLPAGVLLYGPPGCGKTLLAKAIANESGANFISVKGPELLDKYVGESERSVRVVFERARSSSPCIIFFDELDSLCPKRGSDGGGGGGVSERVVNQLLTEMDGLDSRRSVFVIAATNRPELIDPAMLRPGRLDKLLYVPLPSPNDRLSILRALSKKIKLASDVNLETIAHDPHSNGFSGADCAALLREAGLAVLRDGVLTPSSDGDVDKTNPESKKIDMTAPLQITAQHFKYAFDHVLPSVSKKDQARYDRLRERMARARTRGGGEESNAAKSEEEGGVKVSDVQP